MVSPDVFGEDGGRSSHHSDLENQWLQVVDYDEDTGDQNGKPSTLPYPFPYTQHIIITSIAFCQPLSMHCLQSTFTKVKKILSWARTQIKVVQIENLTDVLIDWLTD